MGRVWSFVYSFYRPKPHVDSQNMLQMLPSAKMVLQEYWLYLAATTTIPRQGILLPPAIDCWT